MKGKKLTAKERLAKITSDKAERSRIFKELLKHVEGGYSIDCFSLLSEYMIRKCLVDYPEEFIEEDLADSMRRAKTFWESLGKRQASGECLGNSRSWFYNMANRYGWRDKIDMQAEHKGEVKVNIISYATQKASKDKPE